MRESRDADGKIGMLQQSLRHVKITSKKMWLHKKHLDFSSSNWNWKHQRKSVLYRCKDIMAEMFSWGKTYEKARANQNNVRITNLNTAKVKRMKDYYRESCVVVIGRKYSASLGFEADRQWEHKEIYCSNKSAVKKNNKHMRSRQTLKLIRMMNQLCSFTDSKIQSLMWISKTFLLSQ